ncbi:hypothetical protein V6Z11_D08G218000 [Gossypium hirsutum]
MEASRLMIMSARQPRNLVLLTMLMQIMFGLLQAVEEWQAVSEEEKLGMERQLKIINKSPVKSFKTDYGDIFDCIDIYKQHAFDHPLLKDHKVQVQPQLFSSNYTRLLTYWTVRVDGYRKTGCTNYLCPGFVQVHRQISLGMVLNQISIYNGTQSDIEIAILRDGEWWLKLFNQFIGYWPQKLFYYMYGGANVAVWGGMAASPTNELSPPMGSGHFPKDGHQNKSAYFKQTRIWDNVNFVDPEADKLVLSATRPDCYGSETAPDDAAPNAIDFFYGGPGQCNL